VYYRKLLILLVVSSIYCTYNVASLIKYPPRLLEKKKNDKAMNIFKLKNQHTVFYNMTSHSLVNRYKYYGGICNFIFNVPIAPNTINLILTAGQDSTPTDLKLVSSD
jgi:hypothetical protein